MIAKDIALNYVEKFADRVRGTPKAKQFYGQTIGILMLDTHHFRIPGDVGNATTFPFPVRFKVIEGVTAGDIICEKPDISVLKLAVEKAKELENEGVKAITTSCGFFCYFQRELAEAVNIPVFASSLIQVPLVSKMIGKKRVGIITADYRCLTTTHLRNTGIDESIPIAIVGINKNWSMIRGHSPEQHLEGYNRALPKVSRELVARYPDIGAIVLECTNLPPGAKAAQKATGLPVFDIVTLTYMIHDVLIRRDYTGYM